MSSCKATKKTKDNHLQLVHWKYIAQMLRLCVLSRKNYTGIATGPWKAIDNAK